MLKYGPKKTKKKKKRVVLKEAEMKELLSMEGAHSRGAAGVSSKGASVVQWPGLGPQG